MEFLGLEYIVDANKRIYYVYLLSSLIIASIYLYHKPKQVKVNLTRKLWLHPSAKLDYSYFFLSNMIKVLLIYPIVLSAKNVALGTSLYLVDNFGYIRVSMNYELILVLYTLTLFIVSDFTRYLLHRLLHTIPFLWEFHKVHHSAKVLTPMTFYRVHPIENFLFGFRYALTIGCVTGVFIYFFGSRIGIVEVIGVNVLLFVFSILGSNLRHSHIKLTYPTWLEKILISPYMHQIHHSTKYYNKNFGGYLSIWDNLFNSLQLSKYTTTIKFGIAKNEMQNFTTSWQLLSVPFKNIIQKTISKQKEKKYEIFNLPRSTTSYFNQWV